MFPSHDPEQGKEVEKKAQETYEYFKNFVDSEPGAETDTSKKCMIDALKIQKEARQYSLKIFELLVKMFMAEDLPKKKKLGSIPQTMEELLGDE